MIPNSDDPFAAVRADIDQRLATFARGADIYEQRGELDDDTAARANDFITGLKQLLKEAEDARKAEKKPHMDAAKAVDESWEAIKRRIEKVIGVVRPMLDRHLRRKEEERQKAEQQAREKARAAEAEARRAAEEAAKAASASARIEAEERAAEQQRIAAEAQQRAERAAEPVRVESATGLANRRGFKTVRRPRIESLPQALAHYRARPEVAELILQLAARELREAPTIKGVKQIPNIPGIAWDEHKEIAA